MLFVRVRNACVGSEDKWTMLQEVYWLDGFVFHFQNILNQLRCTVEMEMSPLEVEENLVQKIEVEESQRNISVTNLLKKKNRDLSSASEWSGTNDKYVQVMQIKVKMDESPETLFKLICEAVRDFISQWIVSSVSKEINVKTFRNKEMFAYEPLVIEESHNIAHLKMSILDVDEEDVDLKVRALCAFCVLPIILTKDTQECDKCTTKFFLVDLQYALVEMIKGGGEGRIFKAIHLPTSTTVAVKERLLDTEELVQYWNRGIQTLQYIEKAAPNFTTSKLIAVLDDRERKIPEKYMVLEWVEGSDLASLKRDNSSLRSEAHFLRMMLLLCNELSYLHEVGVLHRDIKPENVMWYQKQGKMFFVFIDFGVSVVKDKGEMVELAINDRYKPVGETNTDREDFHTDIYALGHTFLYFLKHSKIQVGDRVFEIVNSMSEEEIEKRATLKECIFRIVDYCVSKKMSFDLLDHIIAEKRVSFKQPNMCKHIELIRRKNFVREKFYL